MKYLDALKSPDNQPRLIPQYKQTERRLLSVFLALLTHSPHARTSFLKACGYNSGKTCRYCSAMEVTFTGSQVPEVRPDGLIHCEKGKTTWAAFIEAKSEKNGIRTDQIANYIELAKLMGVSNILTISNEFARLPSEPPYHVDAKKSKGVQIHHFAWADIRTSLEITKNDPGLEDIERALIDECLTFFWDEKSGVQTYDSMPETWPAFVEAASTALGFNANVKGLSEIVYGWQQERRDLCSKLTHMLHKPVELRHQAGVRSNDDERTKIDRQELANDYKMSALYFFKESKLDLEIQIDLRACRMTAALTIPVPENKGARASVTWLKSKLDPALLDQATLAIDWPGRGPDSLLTVPEFLSDPEQVLENQKAAAKSVRLILSRHGVRNFKSRKKIISDLEEMVLELAGYGARNGWI